MLLAYRRGLLEPYYPQGVQSIVRETMVIDMLSKEQEAEELVQTLRLRGPIIAPHIDAKGVNQYLESTGRLADYASARRSYKEARFMSAEEAIRESADPLIKAFKLAQKSGIIEQFRQKLQEDAAKQQAE